MLRMKDACGGLQRKNVGGNGSITLPSKAIVVGVQLSITSLRWRYHEGNEARVISAYGIPALTDLRAGIIIGTFRTA